MIAPKRRPEAQRSVLMSFKRFSIGIDLGTSNSAIAITDLEQGELRAVPILQATAPGSVAARPLLPSALYIPFPGEMAKESLPFPWSDEESPFAVAGMLARERGAQVPDRLVTSAKSWLGSRVADPRSPILPWQSPIEEPKISPFDASRRLLRHLLSSAAQELTGGDLALLVESSEVVLTVPASFDEAARTLTHEAAEAAGWGRVTMLEEPQAAFYSWLASRGNDWRREVDPGELVLVVDIGGGTADFTLIAVVDRGGELELSRISVGEHILLGGDNMDLTLAHVLQQQLEAEGHSLDQWQFLALVHAARGAKERLFSDESVDEVGISVPTRGSSLFASTLSARLRRDVAASVVLDGFFPLIEADEQPVMRRATGLQEWGLDYAADPAVSRHLARFLARSLQNVQSDPDLSSLVGGNIRDGSLRPTAVLFNGGVFEAGAMRARVMELLARWNGGERPRELATQALDLAVARGASQYGAVRAKGQGIRIRAGLSRSYYLGLASTMPAVPGFQPPVKGLCVVPQGTEEGTELVLEGREFGLVTGEPVEFRFFSSAVRAGDEVGTVVADAVRELEETARLRVTLARSAGTPEGGAASASGALIPVKLHATVTDVGTLELWMHQLNAPHRWRLEFNVRSDQSRG